MTAQLGRRGLLTAGLTGVAGLTGLDVLASACDGGRSSGNPSPSGSASGPRVAGSVRQTDWDGLARRLTGSLARPGSSSYDGARLTQNPRWDAARPLAVASVASEHDVATALAFARDHGLPLAVRSGGHSYPGWSAGNRAVVIDVRPLDAVTLSGTTASIGAGAALVPVYAALGARGRGVAAGSCPTVGFAGLTMGGGVGVLTRAHGLTCDAVSSMRVVLADGRMVTASEDEEPDLFWALRGGGGGHLGVVTSFTTATFAAPVIATAYLAWPLAAAAQVLPAFLATVPSADRRLWATAKALGGTTHASGPTLLVSATWTGSAAGLDGALAPLLRQVPRPSVDSRHSRSYVDQMLAFAGCSGIPADACHTGPGGRLQREAFAATSHIVTGTDVDVDVVTAQVEAAQSSGLTEAGISIDALGGAVDDLGPTATAFGHRGTRASVQYTATYSGARGTQAQRFVDGFRAAMTPTWGQGAYVNYAQAGLADYRTAYFGDNASRLATTRRAYDPDHVLTQPQDY